jgi:hypothetical protein
MVFIISCMNQSLHLVCRGIKCQPSLIVRMGDRLVAENRSNPLLNDIHAIFSWSNSLNDLVLAPILPIIAGLGMRHFHKPFLSLCECILALFETDANRQLEVRFDCVAFDPASAWRVSLFVDDMRFRDSLAHDQSRSGHQEEGESRETHTSTCLPKRAKTAKARKEKTNILHLAPTIYTKTLLTSSTLSSPSGRCLVTRRSSYPHDCLSSSSYLRCLHHAACSPLRGTTGWRMLTRPIRWRYSVMYLCSGYMPPPDMPRMLEQVEKAICWCRRSRLAITR